MVITCVPCRRRSLILSWLVDINAMAASDEVTVWMLVCYRAGKRVTRASLCIRFFFVCLSQFRFLLAKVASACAHVCAGMPSQKDGWVAWQIDDVSVERKYQQPIYICICTLFARHKLLIAFDFLPSFLSPFEGTLPGILLSLLSYHPRWLFAYLCSFVVKLAYFVFTS
jgi:hypothetical protein